MTLTYKALQAALKEFKAQGLTTVKLNVKAAVLQAEYDRLTVTTITVENINEYIDTVVAVIESKVDGNGFSTHNDDDSNFVWDNDAIVVGNGTTPVASDLPATSLSVLAPEVLHDSKSASAALSDPRRVVTTPYKANKPAVIDHKMQATLRSHNNYTAAGNVSPRHKAKSHKELYANSRARKVAEKVSCAVNTYTANLGETERQAITNGIAIAKNAMHFTQGFASGLKASGRRSYRD